jgi:hypothetical protein
MAHRPRLRTEDRVGRTQRQSASYREHISRLEDSGRSAKLGEIDATAMRGGVRAPSEHAREADGAAITVCEVAAPRWRAAFQAEPPPLRLPTDL